LSFKDSRISSYAHLYVITDNSSA